MRQFVETDSISEACKEIFTMLETMKHFKGFTSIVTRHFNALLGIESLNRLISSLFYMAKIKIIYRIKCVEYDRFDRCSMLVTGSKSKRMDVGICD